MELLLGLRQQLRGQAPDVVEALPAGQPRHRGVAAAVDAILDALACCRVDDGEDRLLISTDGVLHRDAVALLARLPGIHRRDTGRVDRDGIEESALDPVSPADVEHGELLPGLASGGEGPVAADVGRRDRSGTHERGDPLSEAIMHRPLRTLRRHESVLLVSPGGAAGVLAVLEPAVWVGDSPAMQVVDQVEALGAGIVRHPPTLATRPLVPLSGRDGRNRGGMRVVSSICPA